MKESAHMERSQKTSGWRRTKRNAARGLFA
jgi:hypothetical protein